MSEKQKVGMIKLPPGTSPRAAKEFRRIRKELERRGIDEIDRPALMAYLCHHALWEEAKERLEELGPVVETSKGQMQINPWHSIMKQNSELLKKWVQELGFSPASRKRLGLELKEKPTDEELFE
jgi:P27 family predicted phage terminase small subunit